MKMFEPKIWILLFCLTSCYEYKSSWTDGNINKIWKPVPQDLNECLNKLDTMFSREAKKHLIATEESFAVVEISRRLGRAFIERWHLDGSNKSDLRSFFYQSGISDPLAMIRIIFTCYHRKLNNQLIDLDNIIAHYRSSWIQSKFSPPFSYFYLDSNMQAIEDSISNKYYFDKAQVYDTLAGSLFYESHRLTSMPLSYYVEMIVLNKDTLNQVFTIKLIKASSSKNDSIWFDNKIKRKIGDEFEFKPDNWDKKDELVFRYF